MLRFTVPGEPRAKGRPRLSTRGGHAHAYTDQRTVAYEALVGLHAAQAMAAAGLEPIDVPVAVEVVVVVQRPKRLLRRGDPDGLIICGTKPDLDNVLKAVLDGCAPLWTGDQLVADVWARKFYAERGAPPRVEVRVKVLA